MKSLRRIAVLRALHLGDMLCAVPALRALRAAQSRARITLIGLPWARTFVERFHAYIDDLMILPSVPGLPEQPEGQGSLQDCIEEAQRRRFDLAIQLHGSGVVTNELLLKLGAARNAGFYAAGHVCPDKTRFLLWQEVEHEVLRAIRLMQTLGMEPHGAALEFPLTDGDFKALHRIEGELASPQTYAYCYACIHPGARMPSRRWPHERFAEVADRLALQGLRIVLTGSDEERDLVGAVEQAMHMPALNLAGKTDLGTFAALVSQAALVVCNDTGMSHMAAAVGTPSVVVCCGSDPLRWAPLDRERHRVLAPAIFCRPCTHHHCPIGHPCALNVSVDMVMEQVDELFEQGIIPAAATAARHEQAKAAI